MKQSITVTIGIPIFNEERTIGKLLRELLAQKNITIKEIIVVLDGTTDNSLKEITQLQSSTIRIINDSVRRGKAYRLQQIFALSRGDILILMDGDVELHDKLACKKIMQAFNHEKPALIGIHPYPLPPENLFQKALRASITFQDYIKPHWNSGDNYLSFKGNMLALKKSFVKKISIPNNLVNDDSYFYFSAKKLNYHTKYLTNPTIYYTLPAHFADHKKQALRFKKSQSELQNFFPENVLSYDIPKLQYYKAFIHTLVSENIYFISYLAIQILTLLTLSKPLQARWDIAGTTKGENYV